MSRFYLFVSIPLLAGIACAQSVISTSMVSGPISPATVTTVTVPATNVPIVHIGSPPSSLPGDLAIPAPVSGLGPLVAQRDQQLARVSTLHKEIATLESRRADPRSSLKLLIDAISHAELELVHLSVEGSGDAPLQKSIAPMVSSLVASREARIRQLATLESSLPAELEKIDRQLLDKRQELRNAEALLGAVSVDLDKVRNDREVTQSVHELLDLTTGLPTAWATPSSLAPAVSDPVAAAGAIPKQK